MAKEQGNQAIEQTVESAMQEIEQKEAAKLLKKKAKLRLELGDSELAQLEAQRADQKTRARNAAKVRNAHDTARANFAQKLANLELVSTLSDDDRQRYVSGLISAGLLAAQVKAAVKTLSAPAATVEATAEGSEARN
jgi:hypothetical protein